MLQINNECQKKTVCIICHTAHTGFGLIILVHDTNVHVLNTYRKHVLILNIEIKLAVKTAAQFVCRG